ncbi:MAG: hypothetical protein K2X66_07175 [Cyanobacteria bacterium]|nr:hypothetical protein [Cyanobacteriota bacterium]
MSVSTHANAKVVVENVKDNYIPVKSETPISTKTLKHGDEIRLVLTEDVSMGGHSLPVNSVLKGEVSRIHHALPLGQYPSVAIHFKQVCFPSLDPASTNFEGQCKDIHLQGKQHETVYPYRPEKSFKAIVKRQLPIQLASTAVGIPLGAASHIGVIGVGIVEHAVGAVTGMVQEVAQKNEKSMPHKVQIGVLRSTGIPFWYEMLTTEKEIDFPAGIALHFHIQPNVLASVIQDSPVSTIVEKVEPSLNSAKIETHSLLKDAEKDAQASP